MKRKYSRKLIYNAVEFLRAANEELEDGVGEEQVYAMLDAFDPALKRQLLMEMLMGNIGGAMRVRAVHQGDTAQRKKIEAIKEIRAATGFGLKETKDVVDAADYGVSEITGDWDGDTHYHLGRALQGTGYELV